MPTNGSRRLPLGIQQRTEIARALIRSASVFLFDEPNSALTHLESQQLFLWMHRLADRGACVLFVTHRLGELVEHSDAIVVIRDGTVVKQLAGDSTADAVARALVTDEADHLLETRTASSVAPEVFVRLADWRSRRGTFDVPAVEFKRGEVVAVVGVEGSGGREFVASLAGREPVRGRAFTAAGESARTLLGASEYLPASRQESLFDNLTLAENAVVRLGRGKIATRAGIIRRGAITTLGEGVRDDFRVASRSASQSIRSLSGGNQQKIAIAATLASAPRLVAVEEPTRGVDVGSRAEIHRVLRAYAAAERLVAVFCTEVSEAFQLADRVFVMDRGRLSPPVEVVGHGNATALAAALAALERHASGDDDLGADAGSGDGSRSARRRQAFRRRRS